jgi:glycosyltransferase involved in cell wall biosynthesis
MNELVSVIVPIYNVESYLNRCIESIVNQTYHNLEIILVDDGSPDNCPEICDQWALKDPRIIVIHKSNGGLSDARNAALEVARGDYISFVDSDDWIDQDFISSLLDKMKYADIVECGTRICYQTYFEELSPSINGVIKGEDALELLFLNKEIRFTVWNKLYKHSVISDIKFDYGKYNEDNFWTWKVIRNANSLYLLQSSLYNYYMRDNSIMGNSYCLKRVDSVEAFFECYCEMRNDPRYCKLIKNNFISMALYNLQCSLMFLSKRECSVAVKRILKYLRNSDIKVSDKDIDGLWNKLFVLFPVTIAKTRNLLKMGI